MMDSNEVGEFGRIIDVELEEFMQASRQLGEPIFGLANMVRRAFRYLLSFISDGVSMERPDDATFRQMIELLASEIASIQLFTDRNRQIPEIFNHLSTVSTSVEALNWISVATSPVQFVRDMRDAGQYFGNRVLSQFKGNQQHQEWINKWNEVLAALERYVRTFHQTGFNWNVARRTYQYGRPTETGDAGVTISQVHLPPPPPPPPIMGFAPEGGDTRQNLLRDLNQGVDIVRMLKPVNKQQPSQSQQSLPSTSGANLPRQPTAERTYPPKFILDGRKWRVEHQKDRFDLVIDNAEMSHSLALFKCINCVLAVNNKVNGVSIDNCKRTNLLVSDIISAVEVIGCQHVKIQCNGHVPLISIDNCDSVEIFLSDKSLDVEVISSKSTSLNISIMKDDGDYTELAVPEQIKTVVVNGKLVSTVVEKK